MWSCSTVAEQAFDYLITTVIPVVCLGVGSPVPACCQVLANRWITLSASAVVDKPTLTGLREYLTGRADRHSDKSAPALTDQGVQPGAGAWSCRDPSNPVKYFVKAGSRFWTGRAARMRRGRLRARCAIALRAIGLLTQVTIRPEPVQNPSGVCQGCETPRGACLTAPTWDQPQTHTRRGFRLMPVSHSVKAWSK